MTNDEKFLVGLLWGACFGMGWFIAKSNHYKKLAERNDRAFGVVWGLAQKLYQELQEEKEKTEA